MSSLRRLVLDVLKPHEPSLLEFTEQLSGIDGVAAISTSLIELDQEVQNVKITLEGDSLAYEAIEDAIEAQSGNIHSVDHVAFGTYIVEEPPTPQDT